jgi:hypothetical protein
MGSRQILSRGLAMVTLNFISKTLSRVSMALVMGHAMLYNYASGEELLKVSDLPAFYTPIGELAGRGTFYADRGRLAYREDDGNHYHGYDGPIVWAKQDNEIRAQGLIYGAEGGQIVSAGYLTRQIDLVAGKSFHGLTLRELDLPVAYSMTVDFIAGETQDSNEYLWLWHFTPPKGLKPSMLPVGQLPSAASLPNEYEVFACDHFPETRFCPGMGRHFTNLSEQISRGQYSRQPTTVGDFGVIYGEAADKLIFIEYVLNQEDLMNNVSWSAAMPLDGIPIPPIDNVHILHFGTNESTSGRYTVHMYFIPEETYLAWETEPSML